MSQLEAHDFRPPGHHLSGAHELQSNSMPQLFSHFRAQIKGMRRCRYLTMPPLLSEGFACLIFQVQRAAAAACSHLG